MRSSLRCLGWALAICFALGIHAPATADAPKDEIQDQRQRQVAQPGNNAPVWREVRSGEAHTTNVHGVEAGVLIQSRGQTWRQLRPWIASAGGMLLALCVAALALFYRWRGPIAVSAKPTGRLIERFDPLDRAAHWSLAISFVVLAVTGLTLSFGKYLLLPVIGHTLYSLLAVTAKNLHNFIGPLFFFSLVFFIVRYAKDSLPRLHDIDWMRKGGGLFSGKHVPSGRFNAGEKTLYWGLVCCFCAILSVSGFVLDFPNFEQGRSTMQTANVVHWFFALAAIAASLFHIYLGTIGVEGAYQAMRHGLVDETWAKEHHEIWYEEVKAGKSKQHWVGAVRGE
jgi:formate dehydrogenase subunit gamma